MTNTKKKIAVEVEVPDGATHYDSYVSVRTPMINWFKFLDEDCYIFDCGYWEICNKFDSSVLKPIEVIK